mmetsp:Transcript_3990/g.6597  ORF Transcript_3990/g.6597 Transcript_3990/m.6597 type:complete len:202 (-) Transcript_3990:49-654(-)
MEQCDNEECSADEWIQEALYEYEQIANLCNEQSHLGNASSSVPPPPQSNQLLELDPKTMEAAIKYNQLVDHLSTYSDAIDSVRTIHARLKTKLLSLSNRENDESITASSSTQNNKNEPDQTHTPRRSSVIQEAFSNHIELSERVTRTIMKSSKTDCGVLFGNGMIRSSSANDHEVNVVALAALRASISQLKAKFGGSSTNS